MEGTDNTVTVYVAVLEGALQRSVTVTFQTTVLGSDTATGELFHLLKGIFSMFITLQMDGILHPNHVTWLLLLQNTLCSEVEFTKERKILRCPLLTRFT